MEHCFFGCTFYDGKYCWNQFEIARDHFLKSINSTVSAKGYKLGQGAGFRVEVRLLRPPMCEHSTSNNTIVLEIIVVIVRISIIMVITVVTLKNIEIILVMILR